MQVINGTDVAAHPELFDEIWRLRHQVFVEEMGWKEIAHSDGLERDRFDDEHAVHLVSVHDGHVAGYIRALPTTRPHLLTDVLTYLCEEDRPYGKTVWEMSRYCVHKDHRRGRRSLSAVGTEVLAGTVEWALGAGVDRLVFEFEPNWILRALQWDFRVRPLGRIHEIDGQQVVAAELTITDRTLPAIQASRESAQPVLKAA